MSVLLAQAIFVSSSHQNRHSRKRQMDSQLSIKRELLLLGVYRPQHENPRASGREQPLRSP